MYYKVIKDNRVIDVIDHLIYLQWQPRNKIMLTCKSKDAQAFYSSDGSTIWRDELFNDIPKSAPKFDVVKLIEIDEYEYKQLKMLNGKTAEQIADELILDLINSGII